MKPAFLIFNYYCSVCWGPLVGYFDDDDGSERVMCAQFAEHQGFVTQWYANMRRQRSEYDLREVKSIYQDSEWGEMLGLRAPRKTGAELQAALKRNKVLLGRDPGGI